MTEIILEAALNPSTSLTPALDDPHRLTETRMNFLLLSGIQSSASFSQSSTYPGLIIGQTTDMAHPFGHMYSNTLDMCFKLGTNLGPVQRPDGTTCPDCGREFTTHTSMMDHKAAIHDKVAYVCLCGNTYKYRPGLLRHKRSCLVVKTHLMNTLT